MSQKQQILDHLNAGRTLTPMDALYKFGCFRLGARIFELREAGHNIKGELVEVDTRAGKTKVAQYRLEA